MSTLTLEIAASTVIVTTLWLGGGLAAASMTFAITLRRYPDKLLENYNVSVLVFWMMVVLGWYWLVVFATTLYFDEHTRKKFSGLAMPGKGAREEAQRLLKINSRSSVA